MQVKTKNLIVSVLVVVLVGALWYRVVYSSMESKASKAKTAAHEADATAANLRQALNGTSSKKAAKTHDPAADVMLAAVPVDAAEASFLRSVDQIRLDSGAYWQTITPAPAVTAAGMTTVSVGITAQGTEDQLARYVAGLADLKRIFVTDNVSIVAVGSSGAPGAQLHVPAGATFYADKLQLQVSGRIFSQPGTVAPVTPGATGTTPASGTGTTGSSGAAPAGGSTSGGATSPSGIQNN